MKSSSRITSLVAVLGVSLLGTSMVLAQVRSKDPPKTKDSKAALKIPTTGALQAFDGEINSIVIVGSRKKRQPGDLKDNFSELNTFSIRATTAGNWNDNRAKLATLIRQYLKTTLGYQTVSVRLAEAVARPKVASSEKPIHLLVDPAKKTLEVKYIVPGNSMSGRVLLLGPDDLKGTFDLELVMRFETKGSADFPLQLKSTKVHVRNFVKNGDANKGATFAKASFVDPGTAKATTININGMLGEYTAQVGGVVTPGERTSNFTPHLVFELSKAPPVLSPK